MPPRFMLCLSTVALTLPAFGHRLNTLNLFTRSASSPGQSSEVEVRHLSKELQGLLDYLDGLKTQPPCQYAASMGLLSACDKFDPAQFDASKPTSSVSENHQRLYAIRMTHCELKGTDQQGLPKECGPLLMEVVDVETISWEALGTCHGAIERRSPNSWTTYQQLKHRTDLMCHAIQAARGKNESAHFFRVIFQKIGNITQHIESALPDLQNKFHNAVQSVEIFRSDLEKDMETTKSAMTATFDEMKEMIRSAMLEVAHLETQAGEALEVLQQQHEGLKFAGNQVASLGTAIDQHHVALSNLSISADLALDSFRYQTQLISSGFSAHLGEMSESLELANLASSRLHAHIDRVDSRLAANAEMVQGLNDGMDEALTKQTTLALHQTEMQATVNRTEESLERLSATASQAEESLSRISKLMDCINGLFHIFDFLNFNGASWQLHVSMIGAALICMHKCFAMPAIFALVVACFVGPLLSSIVATLLQILPLPTIEHVDDAADWPRLVGLPLLLFSAGFVSRDIVTKILRREYDPESPDYELPTTAEKWSF